MRKLEPIIMFFLDATTHLYKRSYQLVRWSVGPSVPCYFQTTIMAFFKGEKTSNNIKKGTMSKDEVVASDVPPRNLFFSFLNYFSFVLNKRRAGVIDLT